ncbi:MAG TPA: glucose 1-dehydrogenase [Armatimonadota bacterium]|nr:glucose 1-dehydrogenase [Armatimonadota bacterium]
MSTDILSMFRLDGKVALVTGASRGIGLGLTEALASAGADVALCSRSADALQANADRIVEATGRRAISTPADLTDVDQIRATVDKVVENLGRLDVLVNNAGINIREPSLDYTEEQWDQVMDTNIRSPFFVAQAAARAMLETEGGSIINTASMLTFMGRATVPAYAASKGGIGQLTKTLAVEWAESGVRVNAIAPGFISTEMTAPLREDAEFDEWVMGRTPMRRWGYPSDLAGAAVFLASDASAFITGQILAVDGGFIAS